MSVQRGCSSAIKIGRRSRVPYIFRHERRADWLVHLSSRKKGPARSASRPGRAVDRNQSSTPEHWGGTGAACHGRHLLYGYRWTGALLMVVQPATGELAQDFLGCAHEVGASQSLALVEPSRCQQCSGEVVFADLACKHDRPVTLAASIGALLSNGSGRAGEHGASLAARGQTVHRPLFILLTYVLRCS